MDKNAKFKFNLADFNHICKDFDQNCFKLIDEDDKEYKKLFKPIFK